MSIENQPFYNKLSLTVKRKTLRIIELKTKKDYTGKYDILLLILFAVSLIHILFNYKSYVLLFPLNIIIKPFIDLLNTMGWSITINNNIGVLTCIFYYLILIIAIILGFTLPSMSKSRKKSSNDYEALRKDIIKLLDSDFCNCHNMCNCRDSYIDYMDKFEHIDLIF